MSSRAAPRGNKNDVEPFVYRPAIDRATGGDAGCTIATQADAETDPREAVQRARQEGYAEAEKRLGAEYEAKLESARKEIGAAIDGFAKQRESYFARVEEELVNLSLSIARKILHREAQIDPLVLVGLVHVALEKLGAGTQVRLRVHPSKLAMWEGHFRETTSQSTVPELVADAAVAPDGCTLETDVGTTTIGLETHLKEIEQGFFDLLAQRPR